MLSRRGLPQIRVPQMFFLPGKDMTDAVTVNTTALREHETSGHPRHPHKIVTHMMQARFRELGDLLHAHGDLRSWVIVAIVQNLAVDVRAASSGPGFDV